MRCGPMWLLLLALVQAKDEGAAAPKYKEIQKALRSLEVALEGGDCGVVAEMAHDTWKPYDGKELPCGKKLATNCSISYHQLTCPEECPFLAPETHFPCQFSCRKEGECSRSNVDLAYADPDFRLCSACHVTGCLDCDTLGTCRKCSHGFSLSEDRKSCVLSMTKSGWASIVMLVLLILTIFLVLTSVIYCCLGSANENAEENGFNIMLGLRHRHLSKVQDWELESKKKPPRERYSLGVDLGRTNVLGVGFALFYRSIVFMLAVAVISALFLSRMSDASEFVRSGSSTAGDPLVKDSKVSLPATILSAMSHCSLPAASPLGKTGPLKDYAFLRGESLALLYVCLFVLSAWYVKAQKDWGRSFNSQNNSMGDFALLLTGFPADATNEVELKQWAENEVKQLGIPQVQIEGVSIGYDFSDRRSDVDQMSERYCASLELEVREKIMSGDETTRKELQRLRELMKTDGQKVQQWFSDGMKSTGQVFLVFKDNRDKDLIMVKCENLGTNKIFKYRNNDIEVAVLRSEPPDVFWENLHVTEQEMKTNSRKALVEVGLFFLGINCIVVVWNLKVVMPYMAAGSSAGGPIVIVQGIIMAIINGIFGGKVYGGAYGTGYHRKDMADTWLFFVNFFITFCNTIFNLGLMAYSVMVLHKDDFLRSPGYLETFSSATPLGQESGVADKVYLMLVPGQLFTGPLMALLTGSMLNYILHILFAKMIYVWKCLPDPLLNILKLLLPWAPDNLVSYQVINAERGMAAPTIGLPWDYSALLLNPFLVFMSFFMISEVCFRLCCYLALACIFRYVWSRYMHLRVQAVSYYSTGRLDQVVLITWGAPLSTLAACSVAWFIRAGAFLHDSPNSVKWAAVLGTYVLSVCIWASVCQLLHPINNKRDNIEDDHVCTFDACKSQWLFDWINCNPVYMLKCLYYIKKMDTAWDHPLACGEDPNEVRFYRPGREYLLINYKKFPKIMAGDFLDNLEFETWFEKIWKVATKWKKTGKIEPDDLPEQMAQLLTTRTLSSTGK